MSRSDKIALLLSLLAVVAAYLVADRVFERMPHLEDEIAFVWQAQVSARSDLTVASPPEEESFTVGFVIDKDGRRFGKYPLGWPALLSIGLRFGARAWVNPLLAGLAVWLTYRLVKRLTSEIVALLAAGLTLTSPFFLINSGSLLSHPFGLVLSTAFVLAWVDGFLMPRMERRWLPTVVAGLTLGCLLVTRPFTAFGVALPFGLHGLYLLVRGDQQTRLRVLTVGALLLPFAGLHLLWQAALTGDAFTNPYTLWWPYDRVGFGPGHGRFGHNMWYAWWNTRHSLRAAIRDLFGWGTLSWIFLPFGFWALRRNRPALLTSSMFFVLVLIYAAYWIGAWVFGPRYYYEGLFSVTLLTAAGIAWLAGWPLQDGEPWPQYTGWRKVRPLGITALLALLLAANLCFYLPIRLGGMYGLYDIKRSTIAPFDDPEVQALAPALVIVNTERYNLYGGMLEVQSAYLDEEPIILAWSRGLSVDVQVAAIYRQLGRNVYYYYLDEPGVFYSSPRLRGP